MYSVTVLLSAYNGADYIEEQIRSILAQKDVNITVRIRDDGSTDRTAEILRRMEKEHAQIHVTYGENLGYRKSFMTLIQTTEDSDDYYALADQDDYWDETKIISAISMMEHGKAGIPLLYASNLTITDSELNILSTTNIQTMPMNLAAYSTRTRFAGCTFVFNRELLRLSKKIRLPDVRNESLPDHDFVLGSLAFTYGEVLFDENSHILHRRHGKSVTSGGNGIWKRVRVEYEQTFKRNNSKYIMAQCIKSLDMDIPDADSERYIDAVCTYKASLRGKMRLLFLKNRSSGILPVDMEQSLRILLSIY